MSKTLQTRVQMKHDTETNWNKATNFVPLAGEIIVYDVDETNLTPRVKIGDGSTLLADLPFTYLPLTGGTLNGNLEVNGDISISGTGLLLNSGRENFPAVGITNMPIMSGADFSIPELTFFGVDKSSDNSLELSTQQVLLSNIADPIYDYNAATKNYVDERIYIGADAPADINKLWIDPNDNSSSGGTGSGSGGSSTTTNALPLAGGTMQGAINMNGNKITNLITPTADSDAATKAYVDNLVSSSGGTGSGGSSSGGLTQVFHAGTSAPSNTNLLWIDTNSTTGGLKYYNGTSWVHVPVAYV